MPFRDKVIDITKVNTLGREFICMHLEEGDGVGLPYFTKNSMYEGMEAGKHYTLKELGL